MEASLPTLEREMDVCHPVLQARAGLGLCLICDRVLLALPKKGVSPMDLVVPHPFALDCVSSCSWQFFPYVPYALPGNIRLAQGWGMELLGNPVR